MLCPTVAKLLLKVRESDELRRAATPDTLAAAAPTNDTATAAATATDTGAGVGGAPPVPTLAVPGRAPSGTTTTTVTVMPTSGERMTETLKELKWHLVIVGGLLAVFVGDIICVGVIGAPLIVTIPLVSNNWQQYLFGCVALVLSLVLPMGFLTFRLYRLQDYKPSLQMCIAYGMLQFVTTGAGVFVYLLSGSWTQLWIAVFLPILLFTGCIGIGFWVANDYGMSLPCYTSLITDPICCYHAPLTLADAPSMQSCCGPLRSASPCLPLP